MLVPENRRKTITAKSRACVTTMARIPPKSVSRDDREVLKNLQRDLQTMVFRAGPGDRRWSRRQAARAGLLIPRSRSAAICSRPDRRRQDRVARQLARTMGIEITRFDMSEYMGGTVSRLIGARRAMSASTRAGC